MWSTKGIDTGCERTHSVLSVISDCMGAVEISELLAIEPTKIQVKGDFFKTIEIKKHGCYLSTESKIVSTDVSEHLDWLIRTLEQKGNVIRELQSNGCIVTITCNWWSKYGGGGPVLGPIQMNGLVELNIPIGWTIWFKENGN